MSTWTADLARLTATLASAEAYAAAVRSGEFPAAVARHLEEFLANRNAPPAQFEQLIGILLQMIELSGRDRHPMIDGASSWAMDTLLDLQCHNSTEPGDGAEPQASPALLELRSSLFTTAVHSPAGDLTPLRLISELGATITSEAEPTAVSHALDQCAASLASNEEFLEVVGAILDMAEETSLGASFLDRLLQVQDGRRLFDLLTLEHKICVWGNHVPAWKKQLQSWMLAAHREPFRPIGSILDFHGASRTSTHDHSTEVTSWSTAFQRYSHLYVAMVVWAHDHARLLSSVRSMELLGTLAVFLRPQPASGLFDRTLVDKPWAANPAFWTVQQRVQRFATLDAALKKVENLTEAERINEWVGVVEHPHLVLEAMELLFQSRLERETLNNEEKLEAQLDTARSSACQFVGWFYAHTLPATRETIATIVTTMCEHLRVTDLVSGAEWLQHNRASFADVTGCRLRLTWFWMLKTLHELIGNQTIEDRTSDIQNMLELIEYAFRRFTPPDRKRQFQVEIVAQFLVDIEWRSRVHWTGKARTRAAMTAYLEQIGDILEWLTKIVRLLHVDEQNTRAGRSEQPLAVSTGSDVQHLAERLRQLFAVQD